jgi:hypothetical protein
VTARLLPLIIIVVITLPFVRADPGTYVIPLEGPRWTSSTISVHISGGQEWQQNQTIQALRVWNRAQLWFAREYLQNSSIYTFEPGDSNAPVQVTLLNSSTVIGSIQAWTEYRAQNGVIESATVKIGAANTKEAILLLSVHELGHVLGLGHVSCCENDLMIPYPVTKTASYLPTTLDLYAVHMLANSAYVPTLVFLPNNIPYKTPPDMELDLPEPANLIPVLVTVLVLCFVRRHQ